MTNKKRDRVMTALREAFPDALIQPAENYSENFQDAGMIWTSFGECYADDGRLIFDYYDVNYNYCHPRLKSIMKRYGLEADPYDPGTIIIV